MLIKGNKAGYVLSDKFMSNINAKLPNYFPEQYTSDSWGPTIMMQDLVNFGIKLKYPDVGGHTCFIEEDDMREYVFTNLKDVSKLVSVGVLVDDGMTFFNNDHIYRKHMEKITEIKKLNFKPKDILEYNGNKIIKFVTPIVKSDYTFFTYPIIEGQLQLKLEMDKSLLTQKTNNEVEDAYKQMMDALNMGGGSYNHNNMYKQKYLIYKKKYINLKNNLIH